MAEVLIEIVTGDKPLELTGNWPGTLNTSKPPDEPIGGCRRRFAGGSRDACRAPAYELPVRHAGDRLTDANNPPSPSASRKSFRSSIRRRASCKSHIQEMFAEGEKRLKDEIKREMHQPVIEVGTDICSERRRGAQRGHPPSRRDHQPRARERPAHRRRRNASHLALDGASTITAADRYDEIVYDLQMVARANLIFGLHVHVAVEDHETRIQIMNAARYFLPHIFALSVNSPFWCGSNTGWKSYRAKVFERFPRTGLPDYFGSASEFDEFVQMLVKTRVHRQRQEDLVGRPAASVLPDPRVPHLRRSDARRRDDLLRRALSGRHGQAVDALPAEHGLAPLPPRPC